MTFKVKVKTKIPGIASRAREFALTRHGNQAHGCLNIGEHLEDVAINTMRHFDKNVNIAAFPEIEAAAWLHDVVEDTNTDLDEIEDNFGEGVAHIVNLVTDKYGRNRLERHLHTYHMIRQDPDALLVKLCDRRHNQERSLVHGERYLAMYEKEYNYFKFALWTPHKFQALWAELDQQYEDMKKALSW